ncbi:hypothetical protein KNJ79_05295 [Sphingopyxis indica]|uniref:hypothetical protein n=1 Tax=Sphingopyxis indica TaxID=436663 RepID=UPI0029392294|nr:hypothetical protein [Sphingopyxis indica]WOF44348.1 hypothetical protein KNJ79_05295 [Sphingopyxis indica]
MSRILDDLVRAQRVRTNAEQLARMTDPTPDGMEASPGYIPGFRAARNRRLPRPEFREINRGIPEAVYRAGVVQERQVLRAMLAGAGVESRTCAPHPDPSLRPQKPWSQEYKRNDELRLDQSRDWRSEHENWVITQKAESARLAAKHFERMANAFYEAMNPAD